MTKARELAELSRTIIDTSDATAITINADEEVTFADDLFLADGKKAVFGAGSDFQIFHDGNNSFMNNTSGDAGALSIKSHDINLMTSASETMATFVEDGAVTLYHNNGARLATSASGVDVTGTLTATGVLTVIDGSTSAPSISNAGDSNSGIYFPADDELGFLVGGSRKIHITSSGVDIENGSLTGSAATFSGSVTSAALTVTTSTYNKINSYFSGSYISGFKFSDLNGGIWYDAGTDDLTVSAAHANSKLILVSGGSTALTLLSDQSATFSANVGIGKSAGAVRMDVETDLNGNLAGQFKNTHATGSYGIKVMGGHDSSNYSAVFTDKDNATLMMIRGDGSVGIGTQNVDELLHIEKSAGTTIVKTEVAANSIVGFEIKKTNATTSNWRIVDGQTVNGKLEIYDVTNSRGVMTFDQNGTVLIGTQNTGANHASDGAYITPAGQLIGRATGIVSYLNRRGSDGQILQFMKDGTSVGSISTASGYLVIGSPVGSDAHLLIGNGLIHPATSTGGAKDNAIDIGGSSNRFKDLYLSNSINVSKTTAGNITGGTSNQGAVITLHHEAQWENGYTGGDFLGAINFSTGDSSTGEGVRGAIKVSVDSYYNSNKMRFYVAQNNAPTLVERMELDDELTFLGRSGTSPAIEIVNADSEDNDTGREGTLRFRGHRSGGELVTNAQISGHHFGSADDDKGGLIFWANTGSGGLVETLRIRSDKSASLNDGHLIISNGYGVHFGAAAGSGASSTVLDDYEEGTWTPTDESGAGLSFTVSHNRYTKIGRVVFAHVLLTYPSTSNTSLAKIGIPFTCSGDSDSSSTGGAVTEQNIDNTKSYTASVNYSNSLVIREFGSRALGNNELSGKNIRFIVTYFTP